MSDPFDGFLDTTPPEPSRKVRDRTIHCALTLPSEQFVVEDRREFERPLPRILIDDVAWDPVKQIYVGEGRRLKADGQPAIRRTLGVLLDPEQIPAHVKETITR